MWTKSHSIVTTAVTKEQMWKLFADVNNWHQWDEGIEFARLEGRFEKGSHFTLKPKGGPKVKVKLLETEVNQHFLDVTSFPLAKMYDKHTFEETPEGLRITNTLSVQGPLSFLWIKLVAQTIVDALPTDMQKQIETASAL
ncbi:polyketide cyclase [Hymenobacter lutimineralis]|uniref:Polyketide cyclase n=1 Tax=Hymenobacter lutimineralis TaxID=2606448 RepID=A0A5D6UV16_9BACT|nr:MULTISPECIES: SRPBCC family protein [Hymenobacter]QIX62310.1 polyketide cyclase [Hymenobacter sp. BT18]TYZ06907.1 polyketide cyclase [Hymenobacter lutimineralis]